MEIAIGFAIALCVGLTGVGGGSFTTPLLVLVVGLPASYAVGTAMAFAAILRLIAAPFYAMRRDIHLRYLVLLLLGAVPGLAIGTFLLQRLQTDGWNPVVLVVVGALLTISAGLTMVPRFFRPRFAGQNPRWLPWLAVPIGAETGFSSAGAGALGTLLLLNFSELSAAEVVGTDLLFGLVLALLGGAFHLHAGTITSSVLLRLMVGGVPGVILGCRLSRRFPPRRLKAVIALIALALGLQLVWTGSRTLFDRRTPSVASAYSPAATTVDPVIKTQRKDK